MNIFDADSISKLGEKSAIRLVCGALGAACPPAPFGSGDDCALVKTPSLLGSVFLTVDSVVYGRHFDDSAPAGMVGEKLVKRNISDIAAMGARPKKAVCAAVLSGGVSARWLEAFAAGMARAALRWGVEIVGGDFADAGAEHFFAASLTLLGDSALPPLLRGSAQDGDFIYTTGVLGGSFASGHHLDFSPRVEEGVFLAEWNAAQNGAKITSCSDISDGLASDIANILPETLKAEIDFLPARGGFTELDALTGGEDYELLFSVSAADAAALALFEAAYARKFGAKPFRIGRAQKKERPRERSLWLKKNGVARPFEGGGYQHFTSRC